MLQVIKLLAKVAAHSSTPSGKQALQELCRLAAYAAANLEVVPAANAASAPVAPLPATLDAGALDAGDIPPMPLLPGKPLHRSSHLQLLDTLQVNKREGCFVSLSAASQQAQLCFSVLVSKYGTCKSSVFVGS